MHVEFKIAATGEVPEIGIRFVVIEILGLFVAQCLEADIVATGDTVQESIENIEIELGNQLDEGWIGGPPADPLFFKFYENANPVIN